MTELEYKQELYNLLEENDYWSLEIYDLNNNAIDTFGVYRYTELHNEAVAALKYELNQIKNK